METFLLVLWTWLLAWLGRRRSTDSVSKGHRKAPARAVLIARKNRKPEWVLRQLILLKAHLPNVGCRTLAITFNRVFAHHDVGVSKSFVHGVLREHAHAVWTLRRQLRAAVPRDVEVNHCWGIDLTGCTDAAGQRHTLLGVIDHGSRRLLALRPVIRKSGWCLLGYLCLAIGTFGKPKFVRTDNERCFTGKVFARGLDALGIRHQRIDLQCPWQNGRIERFFGTLKPLLRQWQFNGRAALTLSLREFADWYNELRPHQNLNGRTPVEAWNNVDPFHAPKPPRDVRFVQRWDGLMGGFHVRR
ncbi:MAG: transposase [Alcaligenaceae bacterium]|nr:MAG: transposase [Alcaligenaceae bacterium]